MKPSALQENLPLRCSELQDQLHTLFLQTYSRRDEIKPLDLFLMLGILDLKMYQQWRKGDLDTLDRAFIASSRTMRVLTNKMRRIAEAMDCQHCVCRYVKWGTSEKLKCSDRHWLNQMMSKSFKPNPVKANDNEMASAAKAQKHMEKTTLEEWFKNQPGGQHHD